MDVHEHWDGRGLPRGLRGEAIPLLSRIVTVCAWLDIFASVRGPAPARRVVRERGGTWYDPDLTALLLELCYGGRLDALRSPALKEDVLSAERHPASAIPDAPALD